jgi:hypothetical protein
MRGSGISPIFLYKYAFSFFIVGLWLTWLATLLALVSTAGIFPDFVSSGSVDLYLSKPIGRLRLFLTKYAAGLVFVAFQVGIFTFLSFLVLGIRAGIWEPGLFWAIPIVVLFFSYLYALCTLFGVWTRSTIAALLLTLLAWFLFWGVDKVDRTVADFGQQMKMQHEMLEQRINRIDRVLAGQNGATSQMSPEQLSQLEAERASLVARQKAEVMPAALQTTQRVIFGIKTLVPKTRDTIVLLDRALFADQELKDLSKQDTEAEELESQDRRGRRGPDMGNIFSAELERDRKRSIWWIIGTSLPFEAVCLALAAWHFCTRDF